MHDCKLVFFYPLDQAIVFCLGYCTTLRSTYTPCFSPPLLLCPLSTQSPLQSSEGFLSPSVKTDNGSPALNAPPRPLWHHLSLLSSFLTSHQSTVSSLRFPEAGVVLPQRLCARYFCLQCSFPSHLHGWPLTPVGLCLNLVFSMIISVTSSWKAAFTHTCFLARLCLIGHFLPYVFPIIILLEQHTTYCT